MAMRLQIFISEPLSPWGIVQFFQTDTDSVSIFFLVKKKRRQFIVTGII
jgi:hypothetical protein